MELGWEDNTCGTFVAARLFGLSGTRTVGFGGGISFGRGAGTIVILLGPVCVVGTSLGAGMIPGWIRATPPLRGGSWFMIRLGPGRAATCTRVWDIVLILVDVVESALILWVECWDRAEAGRTGCESND